MALIFPDDFDEILAGDLAGTEKVFLDDQKFTLLSSIASYIGTLQGIEINEDGDMLFKTNNTTRMTITVDGIVNFADIPGSSVGLNVGDLYKDPASGNLKVVV